MEISAVPSDLRHPTPKSTDHRPGIPRIAMYASVIGSFGSRCVTACSRDCGPACSNYSAKDCPRRGRLFRNITTNLTWAEHRVGRAGQTGWTVCGKQQEETRSYGSPLCYTT